MSRLRYPFALGIRKVCVHDNLCEAMPNSRDVLSRA